YVGKEDEYEKRKREAAVEDAKTKQLFAQADKEFALGNIEAGNKFLKEAREEKAKAGDRAARALQARSEGLSADLAQVVRGETAARDLAKTEYTAKADLLGRQMTGDIQLRLAEFGADREERLANIKEKFIRTRDPEMIVLARAMGVDPKELFMTRYGSKRGSGQKFSDPAKALETVQALPFNDPLLINYAGLSSDEMMKLGRVKGFGELPLETQKKITRAREILRAQLTTGVVPSHLLSGDED
ncbi:hypothetical protein EB118_25325, partial [bacterium]|nr:hypothetical protein [bacterium]